MKYLIGEKISLLTKTGGFIRHIDHSILMDADWYLFIEYREKLNNLTGDTGK